MYNEVMSDHGPIDPERMYAIKEIAAIFNVAERTVGRWIEAHLLKAYVLGGTIRIYGKDVLTAARAAKERAKQEAKPTTGRRTPPKARPRH
jgi:excisionase family DNA binding protein